MRALACALLLACGSLSGGEPQPSAPAPLFERVVLVGASVSSGFLLQNDVGAPTSLGDVVEEALVAEHEPVRGVTSLAFFLAPLSRGGKAVDRARGYEPSLLFALDFLFWFGYGHAASEDERLERLEQGLWLLDKLDVPTVVCDFPDMSPALEGRGPFGMPMLHPGQVPERATLERLNRRLFEWAAERERIVVVPLASFVERVHANEPVEVRGVRWEASRSLLNKDLLHTSLEGSAALVVLALDRLAAQRPEDVPEGALVWDAKELARRVYDAKEPEREKARERAERR